MNWKIASISLLIGLTAFSSVAQPSDTRWIPVKGWEWQNLRWDRESAARVGKRKVKIWFLIDVLEEQRSVLVSGGVIKPSDAPNLKEGKHGILIDCTSRQYAFFSISWISDSGIRVAGTNFSADQLTYNDIPPDSPWESLAKDACTRVK